jgi:hypothetical protein
MPCRRQRRVTTDGNARPAIPHGYRVCVGSGLVFMRLPISVLWRRLGHEWGTAPAAIEAAARQRVMLPFGVGPTW